MATGFQDTITLGVSGRFFRGYCVSIIESLNLISDMKCNVVCEDRLNNIDLLLHEDATIAISSVASGVRLFHGRISKVSECGVGPTGKQLLEVSVLPFFGWYAQSHSNRIQATAQPVSLAELLQLLLQRTGYNQDSDGITPIPFELNFLGEGVEWNLSHQVQYGESDLNFIQRLCEQYGIGYVVQSRLDGTEIVTFSDRNQGLSSQPEIKLPFNQSVGAIGGESAVNSFGLVANPLPKRVVIRDYNEDISDVDLTCSQLVSSHGIGVVNEYGAGFRTLEDGERLAKIRSEELITRNRYSEGTSNCVVLAPGRKLRFEKTRSPVGARDEYLVRAVQHQLKATVIGGPVLDAELTTYCNSFRCVPFDQQYRPQRLTPKPAVPSLYTARIETSGSVDRAELDDEGRYRISVLFDHQGSRDNGMKSKPVRKAEPYAGPGSGQHFPILAGTEVIVGSLNGDPNRPVVLGALGNSEYPSVVGGSDYASNRIVTPSRARFQIDDGARPGDGNRVFISTSDSPDQSEYFRLGKANLSSEMNLRDHRERLEVSDGVLLRSPRDVAISSGADTRVSTEKDFSIFSQSSKLYCDDSFLLRGQRVGMLATKENVGEGFVGVVRRFENFENNCSDGNVHIVAEQNVIIEAQKDVRIRAGNKASISYSGDHIVHSKQTYTHHIDGLFNMVRLGMANFLNIGSVNTLNCGAWINIALSSSFNLNTQLTVSLNPSFSVAMNGIGISVNGIDFSSTEWSLNESDVSVEKAKLKQDGADIKISNGAINLNNSNANIHS